MSTLRDIEHESIRAFVQSAADEGYLSGRVLDYGCGKQPYRDIVEAAGGEYVGYDREEFAANVSGEDTGFPHGHPFIYPNHAYDAVLCTQVVQYVAFGHTGEGLRGMLDDFRSCLASNDGHLVLTYPTNWPEVEQEDLHRFTKAGMERLLTEAGFSILRHERRATVHLWVGHGSDKITEEIALGYGVVAKA